jgi:hypothetical protein
MHNLTKGQKLILTKNTSTGDWKTALVRPEDFPNMLKGDIVVFEKTMQNFYGNWYGVIHPSSKYTQYIRENEFKIEEE